MRCNGVKKGRVYQQAKKFGDKGMALGGCNVIGLWNLDCMVFCGVTFSFGEDDDVKTLFGYPIMLY